MSNAILQGGASGAGSMTLLAPNTVSTQILTLPDNTGTVVSTGSSAVVTSTMLVQPFTAGTTQATTSGTFIDFTGIPSWVKRITVMLNGVGTNGGSFLLLQLGSGSPTATGYSGRTYDSSTGTISYSTGFTLVSDNSSTNVNTGIVTLVLLSSNTWIANGILSRTDGANQYKIAGSVPISGVVDRVRFTTVNGTDILRVGSANILYE